MKIDIDEIERKARAATDARSGARRRRIADDRAAAAALQPSRYHRFKQHDGRGFGILVIHEDDASIATVLHADMTDEAAALCLIWHVDHTTSAALPTPAQLHLVR